MTTRYGRGGGQGVKYAGGASPVALWSASPSVTKRFKEMPSAAKIKVMVVILLIGIASPFLG